MPEILQQELPPDEAAAVTVAKEVVRRFDGVDLGEEYVIERSYADWDLELDKSDGLADNSADMLRVDVVAHTTQQEVVMASRGSVRFRLPVEIALRRRLRKYQQQGSTGRLLVEEVDRYVLATQKVLMLFHQERLKDFESAAYDAENPTRIVVCPNIEHLRKLRQFTSVLRVAFLVSLRFKVEV